MTISRGLHLIALAPALHETGTHRALFRFAENSSEGIAGNVRPIVHTAPAFDPTAQEAARQKTA
jgi:hypothetical protein